MISRIEERWTVPDEGPHMRLDRYLALLNPQESRSKLQAWIRKGEILVNHSRVKTGYVVRTGDEITLETTRAKPGLPGPEDIKLDVIYEDPDLAVIDKPAGMVCHTGAGIVSGTLVNALLHHFGPLETGDIERPGIVHRLDKLTSGLMVVAKNQPCHRELSRQFKAHEVRKEYLALVYGNPVPPAGTLDWPLGRDSRDRKKISTRARRRREAVTHYRVKRAFGPFSLLQVRIETGRTHQIRVHLARKGHPVVGDTLYGGNRTRNLADPRLQATVGELHRNFLHSHRLEFRHPKSGEQMAFSSPLPEELKRFLESLK